MNSKILVLVVLIILLTFFQGLGYPTRLLQWLARCSFDPVLFEQWEDVCRAELLSFGFFFGDVGTSIRFRCQTQVVDVCWCIDVLLFCEQVGTNLEELDLPFKWWYWRCQIDFGAEPSHSMYKIVVAACTAVWFSVTDLVSFVHFFLSVVNC